VTSRTLPGSLDRVIDRVDIFPHRDQVNRVENRHVQVETKTGLVVRYGIKPQADTPYTSQVDCLVGQGPTADILAELIGAQGIRDLNRHVALCVREPYRPLYGLPDAVAVAWSEPFAETDRGTRVALRSGHPGNGIWVLVTDDGEGRALTSEELLVLIGDASVYSLDYRHRPQAGRSKVL